MLRKVFSWDRRDPHDHRLSQLAAYRRFQLQPRYLDFCGFSDLQQHRVYPRGRFGSLDDNLPRYSRIRKRRKIQRFFQSVPKQTKRILR